MYNDHKVKPLHIMLPKTSAYVKSPDGQTNWACFLIGDDELLEKYNTIWDKVTTDIKKIKSHDDEVTDFYDKKIPMVDSNHTCLAWILLSKKMRFVMHKCF